MAAAHWHIRSRRRRRQLPTNRAQRQSSATHHRKTSHAHNKPTAGPSDSARNHRNRGTPQVRRLAAAGAATTTRSYRQLDRQTTVQRMVQRYSSPVLRCETYPQCTRLTTALHKIGTTHRGGATGIEKTKAALTTATVEQMPGRRQHGPLPDNKKTHQPLHSGRG